MKNKGFTLIELMGVIVILGIIGLIVMPVIQGTIKENTTKLCKDQIKIFEKAAKNYVASNPYKDYNDQKNNSKTLKQLVDEGYLEESQLKNPKGGSFSGTVEIKYDNEKNQYTYQYIPSETEEEGKGVEIKCEDNTQVATTQAQNTDGE